MFKLKYITENSGDSTFENYIYSKGILTIYLFMGDYDKKIIIKIKTDYLYFNNYYLEKSEELYRTCRIEVKELQEVLEVQNNIYVPANNFGKFMTEKKMNYHLAYGNKASEIKYIFSIVGYDSLVSCVLSGLENITIEEDINSL